MDLIGQRPLTACVTREVIGEEDHYPDTAPSASDLTTRQHLEGRGPLLGGSPRHPLVGVVSSFRVI
jgi:hypothetical protein